MTTDFDRLARPKQPVIRRLFLNMLQVNVKRKLKKFLILKSESFQHNRKSSFRREKKGGPTKLNIKVPPKASKYYFTYIAYYIM